MGVEGPMHRISVSIHPSSHSGLQPPSTPPVFSSMLTHNRLGILALVSPKTEGWDG